MSGRIWLLLGALLAGLAVAGGAFGAHLLEPRLSPEMLARFETAMRYLAMHGLALVLVGILAESHGGRALRVAGVCFVLGCVLFSGCLAAYSLTGAKLFVAVVPFGGASFLLGWAAVAVAALGRGARPGV